MVYKFRASECLVIDDANSGSSFNELFEQVIRRWDSLVILIRIDLSNDVLRAYPLTKLMFELGG